MAQKINRVIKFLIASNFFLLGGWGLLSPVFALFILQEIVSSPAEAAQIAGFSALVYWLLKSLLQIPISRYFDKVVGDKDDYWMMVLGLFISGLTPFGFLFATAPEHIYIIQAVNAVGMALVIPSWNAIFTRHIDRGQEAYEWAMDSTFLGFATGITGGAGGLIAATLGFEIIFILVGVFTLFACFLLLLIRERILPMGPSLDDIFSWYLDLLPFKRIYRKINRKPW